MSAFDNVTIVKGQEQREAIYRFRYQVYVEELKQDEVLQRALGPIAEEFIDLKTKEWQTYDGQVTRWEIDEYLTFF